MDELGEMTRTYIFAILCPRQAQESGPASDQDIYLSWSRKVWPDKSEEEREADWQAELKKMLAAEQKQREQFNRRASQARKSHPGIIRSGAKPPPPKQVRTVGRAVKRCQT
jgi:hypothetical protein